MKLYQILASLVCCLTFASALPALAQMSVANPGPANFAATLTPMNTGVTHLKTSGEARFVINGDVLTITIDVSGAPPRIEHWQHFHGFKDGRDAKCPTEAADTNKDGFIDLTETGSTAGTTMVPFNKDPAAMAIPTATYPRASTQGNFHYREMVSLRDLSVAFSKVFRGQGIDLERRVVFIHGVVPSNKLPASVASLGPIPAYVTLPIACGKIKRVVH